MATTPNYGWVTPAPTDLVTDLPADFEIFADAVDADLAGLLGGTTGQVLKKTSNADHAFAFAVDPTTDVVTTAGDLIYGTGADAVTRLGIGTAGQILTVNSGATAPQWSTASASGGMALISTTSVSNATSFSLTSIPGTYKELLMVWENFYSNNSANFQKGIITLNNDSTAANYYVFVHAYGTNNTTGSDVRVNNATLASLQGSNDTRASMWVEFGGGTNTIANGRGWLNIKGYTGTEFCHFHGMSYGSDSASGTRGNSRGSGQFDLNGVALTRIDTTFTNNVTGTVYLYGIN